MGKLARCAPASLVALVVCIAGGGLRAQDPGQGERIFAETAQPPCGLCHTLKAAGSSGEIGPNLDEMQPDLEKIRRAVKFGIGAMPPYDETLSEAEIDAVAAFVAGAVGQEK